MAKKADIIAEVVSNTPVGLEFYRLKLRPADEFQNLMSKTLPGQFGQLRIEGLGLPENPRFNPRQSVLRKPFSFSNVSFDPDNGLTVEILYHIVGNGTERMTTLRPGQKLEILAPLGNNFTISDSVKTAIIVAGGIGVAPVLCLARYVAKKHQSVNLIAFVGARNKAMLPFDNITVKNNDACAVDIDELTECKAQCFVSTDDGSLGFKGFVTELLAEKIDSFGINAAQTNIYCCGPEVMAKSVAKFASKQNIPCQVSLERNMACGIGLCQSCAIESKAVKQETNTQKDQKIYKLCCKDGPIFDAGEIYGNK